jgi:hypothetical protein
MLAMVLIAAGGSLASLAAGFIARFRLAGPALLPRCR